MLLAARDARRAPVRLRGLLLGLRRPAGAAASARTWTPRPLSPYAVGKLTGEHYVADLRDASTAWRRVTLRYFNVFGPRQDAGSPYSGVISLFVTALLAGRAPVIYGDGRQSRDFTYVDNVVDANLRALGARGLRGQAVNVATGRAVTLQRAAPDAVARDRTPRRRRSARPRGRATSGTAWRTSRWPGGCSATARAWTSGRAWSGRSTGTASQSRRYARAADRRRVRCCLPALLELGIAEGQGHGQRLLGGQPVGERREQPHDPGLAALAQDVGDGGQALRVGERNVLGRQAPGTGASSVSRGSSRPSRAAFATTASSRAGSPPSSHCETPSCSQVGQLPPRARGDEGVRQLVAQHLDEARAGAVQAQDGDADGAVVHARRPTPASARPAGRPCSVCRTTVTGSSGRKPSRLRVLRVGLGQGLQDRGAERLVDAAVVADAELRALAGGARARRETSPSLRSTSGSARSARLRRYCDLRALAVAQGRRARRPAGRASARRVSSRRTARSAVVARRADVARASGRPRPARAARAASAGRGRGSAAAGGSPPRDRRPRAARGPARGRDRRRPRARTPCSRRCTRLRGHAEDAAVLLVAELVAFVPGAVRLDHAAVGEGDGVGRAGAGTAAVTARASDGPQRRGGTRSADDLGSADHAGRGPLAEVLRQRRAPPRRRARRSRRGPSRAGSSRGPCSSRAR